MWRPRDRSAHASCVDAQTGRTLWEHAEPSKTYDQHRDNCYATETPTVDADGVVIAWSTPEAVMLLALDLQGSELWRRNLGPLVSIQGSASSPILYQGLVVLMNDQEDMERSPGRRANGSNPHGPQLRHRRGSQDGRDVLAD